MLSMKKNLMIGKSRPNIVEEHIHVHHADKYQNNTTLLSPIPPSKIHSRGPLPPECSACELRRLKFWLENSLTVQRTEDLKIS